MSQANGQFNIRIGGDLGKTFDDFCRASSRKPGDVIRQCLRMLLEGGNDAAEERLTAAMHGHQEWPNPRIHY